jgi:dihydrofolate reductase
VLALIWAQAAGGVIGLGGGIPWRLPEDQARFKRLTMGSTVLMGRKTWESLPASVRPLPGRRNLVVTTDPDWAAAGAERVSSVPAALDLVDGDVWVIGGAAVYAAALPLADQVDVTYVDLVCKGDVFAPELGADWRPVFDGAWEISASGLRYKVTTFERASAIPSTP